MPTATTSNIRGWSGYTAALFFVSLSALAVKLMHLSDAAAALAELPFQDVVHSLTFPNKHRLREHYTGIEPLDVGLRFLVAAFLPGAAGWDLGCQIQQIYFIVSCLALVAIWAVEAGRVGNSRAVTSFTSVWPLLYQTIGGAIIIPLYYLFYIRESSQLDYWSPISQRIPTSYAKALLPSLIIGYILPTFFMYLPFPDPGLNITQGTIALWQVSPIIVNVLLFFISTTMGKEPATPKATASQSPGTLKYLDLIYITCFAITASTHIAVVTICLLSSSPQMSLKHALWRVPLGNEIAMSEALHYIFQVDFQIIFTAMVAGSFLTLWDLKRVGRMDISLASAATMMTMGVLCVGPAATAIAVSYVREGMLAVKNKRRPSSVAG
ncbi:hypothetical protein BU16DRAFT_545529 [Lophium mytilinum]|uniref:Uncharacterized protein n=1 Tax=Lophium mytilinum TaxID=390894 RepID=A0A6A6Q7W2_9PEZI|nr:hypothetical protein BU16DRAFT_545529 [Lophium mytilinum]